MLFQPISKRQNLKTWSESGSFGAAYMECHDFYKLLSEETRLRCLNLLQHKEQLCVCELVSILQMPQPNLSRHLSYLRRSKVILCERKGQWIYYRLNDQLPGYVKEVLSLTSSHLTKTPLYQGDLKKLEDLSRNLCDEKK